jgi:hypothetical protein
MLGHVGSVLGALGSGLSSEETEGLPGPRMAQSRQVDAIMEYLRSNPDELEEVRSRLMQNRSVELEDLY